jgi:hypothetical protein
VWRPRTRLSRQAEALIIVHGFTVEQMVDLCIAGLATAPDERVIVGRKGGRARAGRRGGAAGASRTMTTPPDPVEIAKQAREHAWNWFALHATQRMQAFNFFVVATAFLIAAYASLLDKEPAAAAVLATIGAWLAFWFNRLDARSRQLVEAAEDALRVSQERLANLADNQSLMILAAVGFHDAKADEQSEHAVTRSTQFWRYCTDPGWRPDDPIHSEFGGILTQNNIERQRVVPHVANSIVDRLVDR